MKINVQQEHREHFWDDHSDDGDEEFWSLGRWPIKALPGDTIYFYFDKELVATAIVSRVTKPGEIQCEHSGKFLAGNKVHWMMDSFVDLRGKGLVKARNAVHACK